MASSVGLWYLIVQANGGIRQVDGTTFADFDPADNVYCCA
jgi:hypothetical protein